LHLVGYIRSCITIHGFITVNKLPIYAASKPRRTQISFKLPRTPETTWTYFYPTSLLVMADRFSVAKLTHLRLWKIYR